MEKTGTPRIRVNGEPRALRVESIRQLLSEMGHTGGLQGIAVAVNGEVVPRAEWASRMLRPGDDVDVVGAVQGG
jgi:sulfur carrier protein